MHVLNAFIRLRDDLKIWVTNNLKILDNKVKLLNDLVGDTPVADQIADAIENIDISDIDTTVPYYRITRSEYENNKDNYPVGSLFYFTD